MFSKLYRNLNLGQIQPTSSIYLVIYRAEGKIPSACSYTTHQLINWHLWRIEIVSFQFFSQQVIDVCIQFKWAFFVSECLSWNFQKSPFPWSNALVRSLETFWGYESLMTIQPFHKYFKTTDVIRHLQKKTFTISLFEFSINS